MQINDFTYIKFSFSLLRGRLQRKCRKGGEKTIEMWKLGHTGLGYSFPI